jgi:hypothetical protein
MVGRKQSPGSCQTSGFLVCVFHVLVNDSFRLRFGRFIAPMAASANLSIRSAERLRCRCRVEFGAQPALDRKDHFRDEVRFQARSWASHIPHALCKNGSVLCLL